jgi:hypothetical protein
MEVLPHFEAEGENGPESLFEVQYTDVEGGNYGQLQFIEECSSRIAGLMVMKGLSLLMVTILIFNTKIVSAFENGDTRKEVTF